MTETTTENTNHRTARRLTRVDRQRRLRFSGGSGCPSHGLAQRRKRDFLGIHIPRLTRHSSAECSTFRESLPECVLSQRKKRRFEESRRRKPPRSLTTDQVHGGQGRPEPLRVHKWYHAINTTAISRVKQLVFGAIANGTSNYRA